MPVTVSSAIPEYIMKRSVYEAEEGSEPLALHNYEHHNLRTSPVIGTNVN
jgi:hypothetical protein